MPPRNQDNIFNAINNLQETAVKALVSQDVDLNKKSNNKNTPLEVALIKASLLDSPNDQRVVNIIKMLLQNGANPLKIDKEVIYKAGGKNPQHHHYREKCNENAFVEINLEGDVSEKQEINYESVFSIFSEENRKAFGKAYKDFLETNDKSPIVSDDSFDISKAMEYIRDEFDTECNSLAHKPTLSISAAK